jgi:hypothetical protein
MTTPEEELALARATELAELTERHGAERAQAILDRLDRQRAADLERDAANDPLLSPRSALVHHGRAYEASDAAMYSAFDDARRLRAAGQPHGPTARIDLPWALPWDEARDGEKERRIGDLVLDGHSLADARRLAPTTPARPDAIEELITVPLTVNETLRARAEDWREQTERSGSARANELLAQWATSKMADIAASAERDTRRSPTSAHIYAASRAGLAEAMMYRQLRRSRQLRAAGVGKLLEEAPDEPPTA